MKKNALGVERSTELENGDAGFQPQRDWDEVC